MLEPLLQLLRDPVWQGAAAIIAIVGAAFAIIRFFKLGETISQWLWFFKGEVKKHSRLILTHAIFLFIGIGLGIFFALSILPTRLLQAPTQTPLSTLVAQAQVAPTQGSVLTLEVTWITDFTIQVSWKNLPEAYSPNSYYYLMTRDGGLYYYKNRVHQPSGQEKITVDSDITAVAIVQTPLPTNFPPGGVPSDDPNFPMTVRIQEQIPPKTKGDAK